MRVYKIVRSYSIWNCHLKTLKIIKYLPISDLNYKTTLELLIERYSNRRGLNNALIKKLIGMTCISTAAQSIWEILDAINECLFAFIMCT